MMLPDNIASIASSAAFLLVASICRFVTVRGRPKKTKDVVAYEAVIGNTPLLKLAKVSQLLGRDVYVKMECMNPGGTGKDRASKFMIAAAREEGLLKPGGVVVEGTSGSTGISLACLCQANDYTLHIVMPDDQSNEKRQFLGAKVTVVPCCAIANSGHYVKVARKLAEDLQGVFIDQFENKANFLAHYTTTGPELWEQSGGAIDAFVMSAGTGGTIAGVSRYLKDRLGSRCKVVLADPEGSSLFHRVKQGVCYAPQQSERRVRKHRYDSIVEGVGLDRVTKNFEQALIDDAVRISDQDILNTAHWLLKNEGLWVGSSSALNVAAACTVALTLPRGSKIVTIVCDNGGRHLSRFWNPEYVGKYNLVWPADSDEFLPAFLRIRDLQD